MYKILIILFTSIILFADTNQTDIPSWLKTFIDNNSTKIENISINDTNVKTSFYINKKMQKKHSSFIANLKEIALFANKENFQTKQIKFSGENNNTLYVSPKIQQEYPHILEGLKLIEKEAKKPENKRAFSKFYISYKIEEKNSELIQLIYHTESMDDDERQYWYDIMPSMTDKQIGRLEEILETEKKKLEALEIKYQKEIKSLNEKYLIEWRVFQLKKIQDKERKSKKTNYDTLLKNLKEL